MGGRVGRHRLVHEIKGCPGKSLECQGFCRAPKGKKKTKEDEWRDQIVEA